MTENTAREEVVKGNRALKGIALFASLMVLTVLTLLALYFGLSAKKNQELNEEQIALARTQNDQIAQLTSLTNCLLQAHIEDSTVSMEEQERCKRESQTVTSNPGVAPTPRAVNVPQSVPQVSQNNPQQNTTTQAGPGNTNPPDDPSVVDRVVEFLGL